MTDAILAWDPQSPQWPEVLAAARGAPVAAPLRASALWQVYRPLVEARGTGVVIGQLGQSLDGRIATASGHSHYINGAAAIAHLHRLRALVDAVVIGVGTVVADDPQLTVRRVAGNSPARIVIDPTGRAPPAARMFAADGPRRIVVCREPQRRIPGVEYITRDDLAPPAIVLALRAAGLRNILVEGGARTVSGFLAHQAFDRLHVLVAPMIIGSGPTGIMLPEIATLADAQRPRATSHMLPGGDVLFDCDMR